LIGYPMNNPSRVRTMLMLLFAFQLVTDLVQRWWRSPTRRPVLGAIRVSAKTPPRK